MVCDAAPMFDRANHGLLGHDASASPAPTVEWADDDTSTLTDNAPEPVSTSTVA